MSLRGGCPERSEAKSKDPDEAIPSKRDSFHITGDALSRASTALLALRQAQGYSSLRSPSPGARAGARKICNAVQSGLRNPCPNELNILTLQKASAFCWSFWGIMILKSSPSLYND